jgi:hypothetical protein
VRRLGSDSTRNAGKKATPSPFFTKAAASATSAVSNRTSRSLFIVGGILAGGGAGVLFKNGLLVGSGLAEPQFRGEALAGLFLISYIGLVVPVLGVGIATLFVPLAITLLWFAALITAVVIAGGIAIIRGR